MIGQFFFNYLFGVYLFFKRLKFSEIKRKKKFAAYKGTRLRKQSFFSIFQERSSKRGKKEHTSHFSLQKMYI